MDIIPLLFQTAKRHDIYTIFTTISVRRSTRKNHLEGWTFHFCGINFGGDYFHCFCAFFDQFISSKLDLDQAIRSISQMNNSITFQAFFCTEMTDFSAEIICKDTQVTDTHGFKQQTAGI